MQKVPISTTTSNSQKLKNNDTKYVDYMVDNWEHFDQKLKSVPTFFDSSPESPKKGMFWKMVSTSALLKYKIVVILTFLT